MDKMNLLPKALWISYGALLFVIWLALQKHIIFSPDVSYLLYATNQFMHGGRYVKDIFETNPPMILYLYMPVLILAKYLDLNWIVAARCYVLGLMVVSSMFSYTLLKTYCADDTRRWTVVFAAYLFILFVLPQIAFAQREHLLLLFLLPYVFANALWLNHKNIHGGVRVTVGILAGLVFALKPYFLAAFIAIEVLMVIKKRSAMAWVRLESISVIFVTACYAVSLWIYQPEYIHTVLPLVASYYLPMVRQSWWDLLSNPYVFFCMMVAVLYPWFFNNKDKDSTLSHVLYVTFLGMMLAFLLAGNAWYYHVLPALSLGFLLMVIMMSECGEKGIFATLSMVMAYVVIHGCFFLQSSLQFTQTNSANHLITWMSQFSGEKTMSCFTTVGTSSCFPAIYAIQHGEYQGRFPFFWWYRGVMTVKESRSQQDKSHFVLAVAEDLNRFHPKWVVIDTRNFSKISMPMLAVFNENATFYKVWQQYSFYSSLDNYQIYIRKT